MNLELFPSAHPSEDSYMEGDVHSTQEEVIQELGITEKELEDLANKAKKKARIIGSAKGKGRIKAFGGAAYEILGKEFGHLDGPIRIKILRELVDREDAIKADAVKSEEEKRKAFIDQSIEKANGDNPW